MRKEIETTSLYIHVPFCLKKCPYCDFFSVPVDAADIDSYADLLIKHLQLLSEQSENNKKLESIFFGGGTPSLLLPEDVGRILREAEERFGFTENIEISLEANPGTVDAEKLAGFRSSGINRLSVGVQTLCDKNLHLLGRPHSAAEAEAVLRQARQTGFDNLSADLMFALPGQTVGNIEEDLDRLLAHNPEHLAIYGLTFEEGTTFFDLLQAGKLEESDEESYVAGYRLMDEAMNNAGYRHYEISNFARPGFECRHNLRYWRRQENLAIGAGAHSFRAGCWGQRQAIPDDLELYVASIASGRDPAEGIETFSQAGAMFETLYLGLRTAEGVPDEMFRQRFGCSVAETWPDALVKCGAHLQLKDGFWRLDLEGWLLFNTILSHFD